MSKAETAVIEKAMLLLFERKMIPEPTRYAMTKYALLKLAKRTVASVLDGYQTEANGGSRRGEEKLRA